MSFEQTLEVLETFGYNNEIYTLFEHGEAEHYRKSVGFMRDFVKRAMAGSDLDPLYNDQDSWECIRATLTNFIRAFALQEFDQIKYAVLDRYVLLVENFLKATDNKCERIVSQVAVLRSMINYQYSMVGAISVIRRLLAEAEGFMNFKPPAFELSRHYLQVIDERLNCSK